MSPLFMDTEPNTPDSLSAEECHSNAAGSEREGEGQHMGPRGTKRREKNRDAARKSRKKQTERADELHEELQGLEQSNTAFQKEIAALRKELHLYTTALERHEPHCRLRASSSDSGSSSCLLVTSSADCHTSSTPSRAPPQALNSTVASSPSLSTSLTSSLGLPTLRRLQRTRVSPSASVPRTTSASSAGLPAKLFTASSSSSSSSSCSTSPVTAPYSASFSTHSAPHSLFSEEPRLTSRPTSVIPGLVSEPGPSAAAQPQSVQDIIHETSSVSAADAFLMTHASFQAASSNIVPPYSHFEAGSSLFSGNPNSSTTLLPSPLPDPPPQTPPVAHFPLNNQQVSSNPASLLSLLTVPSPLDVSQPTSSSFDEGLSQSLSLLLPPEDPSNDLSFSELLEMIMDPKW